MPCDLKRKEKRPRRKALLSKVDEIDILSEPIVVQSQVWWDSKPPSDLRCGEIALLLEFRLSRGIHVLKLVSLEDGRVLRIKYHGALHNLFRTWMTPVGR